MRLDMRSRKAIIKNTCREYRQAGKKGRGEIPDRLVPVTGMNRDCPAALLGRCGELLLGSDGSLTLIRRKETLEDYFATLPASPVPVFETGGGAEQIGI
jgi:hypothetical protein